MILLSLVLDVGCNGAFKEKPKSQNQMPTRPVLKVLKDHADELMAIPNVVGVYEGTLDDGRPCIKVMVKKKQEN